MHNSAFFPWVVSHLSFIGWPVVLTLAYKIFRFLFKAGRVITIVEQRVLDGERTLHLMATNHLPHIQAAVEESNKHMQGIREDLRLLMVKD